MDVYDRDDTLDRPQYLMNDHDDYNTYSLDWPENVFGEELPTNVSNEGTDDITFNEDLESDDTAAPEPAGDDGMADTGDEADEGDDEAV